MARTIMTTSPPQCSPGHETTYAMLEKDDKPQTRKDRKRATDRIAQREHRKRQKLYVQKLEAQLEALKRQCSQGQEGALWKENEQLRQEAKALRALFSSIESLLVNHTRTIASDLGRPTPASNCEDVNLNHPTYSSPPKALDTINDTTSIPLHTHDAGLSEPGTANTTAIRDTIQEGNISPYQMSSGPADSSMGLGWWDLRAQDTQQNESIVQLREIPPWIDSLFTIGSLSPSAGLDDLGNLAIPNACYQDANSLEIQGQPNTCADDSQGSATEVLTGQLNSATDNFGQISCTKQTEACPGTKKSKFEVAIHRSLPHVLLPPLIQDVYVHEIIERARSNALSQRMLLSAPTLADFLIDNPRNVLSADLKKYLEPVRQSRRTAEYLGTYWVSYLLLRWQVNQSPESFERIPPWFRPTQMQMHVAHPIAIDFIAWPSLRDELIKFSMSEPDQLHTILTRVGTYLEVNLESAIAQSFADEAVLNEAVCDLRNWKLRDGFFTHYPQWRGLCEHSIVEDTDDGGTLV